MVCARGQPGCDKSSTMTSGRVGGTSSQGASAWPWTAPTGCGSRTSRGQLAKVATRIAEHGGLIGDVNDDLVARNEALREITVELRDKEHAEALAAGLGALPGRVSVVWFHDRAFIAHDGGKLEIAGRRQIRTNQDVRDVYTPGVARVCAGDRRVPAARARASR